mmetsp:Transcript_28081/g.48070  ORF Transcript_28081/g.48070 Transcript_28081/m.48070 type:complete len:97 (-) Transcript_28081:93-383(-)|eukprot:gene38384-43483_t
MNSIARIARTSATMAKRANVARTFVSTPKALGGAKHDAHAHGDGHDDHEHHDHPMWEDLPFGKTGTGLLVFGGSTVMVGLILMACNHQQKKQGFAK